MPRLSTGLTGTGHSLARLMRQRTRRPAMTRILLVLATASTLTLSHALAQQNPSGPASPGAATSGAASDQATRVQSAPGTGTLSPNGTVTGQTPDQWLASKFKGTT